MGSRTNTFLSHDIKHSLLTFQLIRCQLNLSYIKGRRTQADFLSWNCRFFCRGQIGLKFVGPSACRSVADFLSQLTELRLRAESSIIVGPNLCFDLRNVTAALEKTLVHVTLMTFPNWLRRARAPTNCLGPPHTSRQGPTRRFEI